MFIEVAAIIALLALGAIGYRMYQNMLAASRRREEDHLVFGRHDHHRAHESAKAQAELSRWGGPH